MRFPIVQVCCVGRQRVPIPLEMHRTQVWPNNHVNHVSYGNVLMSMWRQVFNDVGMLWLEGDIAITPEHLEELADTQACFPDRIISVPYLLYRKSTQRKIPMWSNQGRSPLGSPVPYDSDSIPLAYPEFFSLGCTYLPKMLLDLVALQQGNWDYPCLDTRLSELAYDNGFICIATETPCLHLHY